MKNPTKFKLITEEEDTEQHKALEFSTVNNVDNISFEDVYTDLTKEKVDPKKWDEKVYGEVKGLHYTINIKPIIMKCIIAAVLQLSIGRDVFS